MWTTLVRIRTVLISNHKQMTPVVFREQAIKLMSMQRSAISQNYFDWLCSSSSS
jgi:hypothetical protein